MISRSLQEAGHDVATVAEVAPSADDTVVIDIAVHENRILLTEDKDFGQLVYASGSRSCGIILLRYPFPARAAIARKLVELVSEKGEQLSNCFVVIQPGRIRIRRTPVPGKGHSQIIHKSVGVYDPAAKTVRVCDPDTKKITTIPVGEVGPGMVRVSIDDFSTVSELARQLGAKPRAITGVEGEVWIEASKLPLLQPPFSAEDREVLVVIRDSLQEVHPLTLEQWEDRFRRDANPKQQIADWLHVAKVYKHFSTGRDLSPEQKLDVFTAAWACSGGPSYNSITMTLRELSLAQADEIWEYFFTQRMRAIDPPS